MDIRWFTWNFLHSSSDNVTDEFLYAGNPAWECICTQNKWLIDLFSTCVTEHTNREHDEVMYGNNKRSRARSRSLSVALLTSKSKTDKVSGFPFLETLKVHGKKWNSPYE